ncbi:hypothetical protein RUND412_004421 [Rhizina undulata]
MAALNSSETLQGPTSPSDTLMADSENISVGSTQTLSNLTPLRPRIRFNPPLFIQRRMAIHAMLRELASVPRFKEKLHSFLDVGCGIDCFLLRSLIPCEDELPLEQITGLDIDEKILEPWVSESVAPGGFAGSNGKAEERWRALNVTLLNGSFLHLNPKAVPRHDIIVSTEVIEHLDPVPLSNFSLVLLGKMKPKICIITTPNRDFNKLFDTPFYLINAPFNSPIEKTNPRSPVPAQPVPFSAGNFGPNLVSKLENAALQISSNPAFGLSSESLSPTCSISREDEEAQGRYWREGVPYSMRHHDHRFEWTRKEFRDWANNAADLFGYDVFFTGVGGLGRGLEISRGPGWDIIRTLTEAVVDQSCPEEYYHTDPRFDSKECLAQNDLEDHICSDGNRLADRAKIALGDCSQIAVFLLKEDVEKEWEEVRGFRPRQGSITIRPRSGSRSEGTATPVILGNLSRSITPDNWVSHPSSGSDLQMVCNHVFPWAQNDEYPPSFKSVLEMIEEVLFVSIPKLVLEEWQKSPAQKVREARERQRKKGRIFYRGGGESHNFERYFAIGEDRSLEDLAAIMRDEIERQEKIEAENLALLQGKRTENIQEVRVTIGTKKVWQSSWKLQRACRFHYEVFKEIVSGTGPTGILGLVNFLKAAQNRTTQTVINTTQDAGPENTAAEAADGLGNDIPKIESFGRKRGRSISKSTLPPPDSDSTIQKHMIVQVSKSPIKTISPASAELEDIKWSWSTVKVVFNPPHQSSPSTTTSEVSKQDNKAEYKQPIYNTVEDYWAAWDAEGDIDTDEAEEAKSEKYNDSEHWYNAPRNEWKSLSLLTEVTWRLDTAEGNKPATTSEEAEGNNAEDILVLAPDGGIRKDMKDWKEETLWEADNIKMDVCFFKPKFAGELGGESSGIGVGGVEIEDTEGEHSRGGKSGLTSKAMTAPEFAYAVHPASWAAEPSTLTSEQATNEWGYDNVLEALGEWI